MALTPNQIEALRRLYVQTARSMDCWRLAGSSQARLRAEIMTDLLGAPKRVPQAQAGVTLLVKAFWGLFDLDQTQCQAVREDEFRAKAIAALTAAGRLP